VAGVVQNTCVPGAPLAPNDATCNGIDDNCNGLIDENYKPRQTSCGVGACASTGMTSCSNGVESDSCHPGTPAANDATCDGIDDDCDSLVDEDYVSVATSCGIGACAAHGRTSCVSGHVDDSCHAGAPAPSDTTCNGIDDNCNGQVDEGYVSVATSCGVGACAATGATSCTNGTVQQNCTPKPPAAASDATCNGIDEDCDGQTDEDYVPVATTCGLGVCVATGMSSCVNGTVQPNCTPKQPIASTDATCNGIDEDCDGQTDEDFVPACAGSSVVTCVSGLQQLHDCNDGNACNGLESCNAGACVPGTPPQIDDGNPCTTDGCNPSAGVTHTPVAANTSCGPNRVCDGNGNCFGPPFITADLNDQTVPLGGTLSLTIQAGGTQLQYQWMLGGTPISGATSATYTKPNVTAADDGTTYSVVVSNPAGSVTSRTAKVTVGNGGPTLVVNNVASTTTTADFITLTGTATPSGSPIDKVFVTSDRYAAPQSFAASYDPATNAFTVDVPLKPGLNNLTVVARDRQGQAAQSTIAITETLNATPALAITSPVCGSVVGTDTVTVSGTVASTLAPNQIRLTLGTDVRFPTDPGTGDGYVFSFPGVHLTAGPNTLLLKATTPDGTTVSTICVLTRVDGADGGTGVPSGTPPTITVSGASADVWVSTSSVAVAGTVTAARCVQSVTVNGRLASLVGSGPSVSFQSTVVFPNANTASMPVTVVAVDCDGASSQLTYTLHLDTVAPVISVQNLQPTPAINSIVQTPYAVQGTVVEANLASLTANGQSVSAVPGATAASWDFAFNASLTRAVDNPLSIVATDLAGNTARFDAVLRLTATVGFQVVAPLDGDQFVTDGAPVSVAVVAQVSGLGATDSVLAAVDGGSPSALTLAGSTAKGSVSVAATTGRHVISIVAQAADGTVLGRVTRTVTVTLAQDIPITVTRTDPPSGASGVEPTQFVAFYFNRPIDPTKLAVTLTETVHGLQYVQPPSGVDATQLNNVQLSPLDRSNDPVPGGLGFFPGNTMAAFYPSREFGYGGTITVAATYDGKPISNSNFAVRPLPTLISGFVADQFHTPITGMDVVLEDVGVHATTDSHGYFGFGFGNFANAITAGVHRLTINPNLANGRYGAVRLRLTPQDGRLTTMGVVHAPQLNPATPFAHIGSGAPSATLAGGSVVLNLSGATLLFPNGHGDGDVHVQAYLGASVAYPAWSPAFTPLLTYNLQPAGISVTGTASVDFAVPPPRAASDWAKGLPARVLLLGVDPTMLQLVPIGVGVVDKAARRIRSEGVLELSVLDFIGFAVPLGPNAQTLLASYAGGGISIRQIAGQLQGH
jgi:hypothetical protein